jgi:GNAT superfamily N-acetyltransferase
MLYSDQELARRLERTEAASNVNFVEARQQLFPDSGAEWISVAGAYAMFDGPDSPLTQTFGLGLFDAVTEAELAKLEAFFAQHNAPVYHEISPMADAELLPLLTKRGYQPIEFSSVLYQPLTKEQFGEQAQNLAVQARLIAPEEAPLWATTSATGWSTEMPGVSDFMQAFCLVSAKSAGAAPFLAELSGEPIAAGGLFIHENTALLAGASTVPAGRRQGAQQALLEARLRYAAEQGCTLAMMGAAPGSQSQRNAEKQGFRIAYTRIKWALTQ